MARVQITDPDTYQDVFADEVILRAEPVDLLNVTGRKIANTFRAGQIYDVDILTRLQRAQLAFSESGSIKMRFYDGD